MKTDEQLRLELKQLKKEHKAIYKEVAEYLGIKVGSLYNYLSGNYSLKASNKIILENIINNL